MNREIKFRGYNYQYEKWFYGSLFIQKYDNDFILSSSRTMIIDDRDYSVMVDNGTIGQYTGLKDKNGVEIYEGDLIEYKDSIGKHIEEVKFDKGCFYAGLHGGSSTRVSPKLINTRISKVIGNIYENEVDVNANCYF